MRDVQSMGALISAGRFLRKDDSSRDASSRRLASREEF
jgi:hypothetical protein